MNSKKCVKCDGTGYDWPYDPDAKRGSLENPYSFEEARELGLTENIPQEAELAEEEERLVAALVECKICGGIGYVYDS
jgi:hypothetical protein